MLFYFLLKEQMKNLCIFEISFYCNQTEESSSSAALTMWYLDYNKYQMISSLYFS